jgi:RNA polymerase sigma-70 factor (ECF subfamily)
MAAMAQSPQGIAEFESLLYRAWETGRRQWPKVDLPAEVFIRHLTGLLPKPSAERPLAPHLMQLDLAGLYLACACVNDVSAASEMFEQHYMAKLPGLLRYLKLSDAMLDEVCQWVRTQLLVRTPESPPRLKEYTGRGALLSWMRVIAVRMALRQGASVREIPDENGLAALATMPAARADAELTLMKSRYRHEFRQAVREAFAALSDDQRYLLRLHFIEGLPTTRMGPLFGKDQSTISRWLKDARQKVYEETKHRLQERLRLSSQEFESLMSAIQSNFDVSLSQILGEKDCGREEM